MVWSFCRLVRLSKSLSDKMVNKLMITLHIVDYLALIIVDVISYYFYFGSLRAYEISVISGLLVYCVCNVIFCLLVN